MNGVVRYNPGIWAMVSHENGNYVSVESYQALERRFDRKLRALCVVASVDADSRLFRPEKVGFDVYPELEREIRSTRESRDRALSEAVGFRETINRQGRMIQEQGVALTKADAVVVEQGTQVARLRRYCAEAYRLIAKFGQRGEFPFTEEERALFSLLSQFATIHSAAPEDSKASPPSTEATGATPSRKGGESGAAPVYERRTDELRVRRGWESIHGTNRSVARDQLEQKWIVADGNPFEGIAGDLGPVVES